eukprot:7226908-Ditylum_brightwellii.AAC.2
MRNVGNIEKTKREILMYSLRLSLGKQKKAVMKVSVQMCALDIQPFTPISGVDFRGLLKVCMNIAQNVEDKIDVDKILPHPTTVSWNVDIHAGKVGMCLAK